ncbi:MAG TPA: thioesterase family protein [Candidatus Acidoferrales bacterium]|nr:thioesterase family protein [Candidatus Acidoferrales bacterium]
MSDRQSFEIEEYVRWSDVDAAGIVCYGAFVRFVEVAETELFRAAGMPYSIVFDEFNCWLPRVHFSCDFYAPARLDERLKVAAFVKRLGKTSVTLGFEVKNKDDLRIASFEVVLVCIDRTTFEKRELPAKLRAALSAFLE